MKSFYLLFSLLLSSLSFLHAQELVRSTYVGSFSEFEISTLFGITPNNGVDMYKVVYTTPDAQGVQDTASGLLCIPSIGGTYPLLAYQHGTVGGPSDVPSKRRGGYELAVIFASFSYITTAADFLGLGESRGFHPYVHAATEASAGIDMLYAAQDFIAADVDYQLNDQLFITGYSQGGHAAMAMHRELETNYTDDFTVTAAAPLSGPYDISGVMTDLIFNGEEYGTVAYLPNLTLGYEAAYGNIYNEISDLFVEPYASMIERFYNEEVDLFTLNEQLIEALITNEGASIPMLMLQDSVVNNVKNNPNHPINVALRDNDTYDWIPVAPTRLYYCMGDDQVPFRNSIIADSVMNANGALDVAAANLGDNLDHGGCVGPAATATIFFFMGKQDFTMTGINDYAANDLASFYPNPAKELLNIHFQDRKIPEMTIEIVDLSGKLLVRSIVKSSSETSLDVSTFAEGVYFIKMYTEEGYRSQKLIIQR